MELIVCQIICQIFEWSSFRACRQRSSRRWGASFPCVGSKSCELAWKSYYVIPKKAMHPWSSACESRRRRLTKNRSTTVVGRCLGNAWGALGPLRRVWRQVSKRNQESMAKWRASGKPPRLPRRPLGLQWVSADMVFLVIQGILNIDFLQLFVRKGFIVLRMRFSNNFPSKLDEAWAEKKRAFVLSSAVFFEGGDLHDSMYFVYRKQLFHFLKFGVFLKKACKKALKNQGAIRE